MNPIDYFSAHYLGITNPMTPVIVEYGRVNDTLVYELSHSISKRLWGVTCLRISEDGSTLYSPNNSEAFHSRDDAVAFINKLKEN